MLCHHWTEVAFKADIDAAVKPVDASMAEDIMFKQDGTYNKTLYDGRMKITGNWYLNSNETKMDLTISSLNGKDVSQFNDTTRHFNIIILKLSSDTLIYGEEFYRGKEGGPMVYNHSDRYLVRKD